MQPEYTFTKFEQNAQRAPDATAIIFLGERFSYGRLQAFCERFAAGLAQLGVKKGERVIIYLANCVQYVIAFMAAQKLGAAVVLVSPIYTSRELEYMIRDSGARTIICHDTNFGYVQEATASVPVDNIIVTRLLDLLPAYKRAVALLFDKAPRGKVVKGPSVHTFQELLSYGGRVPLVQIDAFRDLSYILYTGGTTGFPKGVPGNHAGHTSYINDLMEEVLAGHARPGGDVYIGVNPLFHIMALGFFMALGLNMGNATVLMPSPQIDAILEAVQRYRVRWFLGVPALYRMVLENDRMDKYDLSSIKYSFCGGDMLPREVYKRWKDRVGVPIHQVYGSTEAGHVTYSRIGMGEPELMSVGLPLKSRKCLVVDSETLEPVKAGETGELVVTSRETLKEYLNKPEETARSFVRIRGKTHYRTGDFVRMDPGGEIFYVERSADILKHKGYRVSASEIEAVLQDHPVVVGACVVGVPDAKVGERIKAIVVLKEDAKGVGGAELVTWCRRRLATYKVPSYIEFRDMLPKSKVGKLLRREIRAEENRKQEKEKGAAPQRDEAASPPPHWRKAAKRKGGEAMEFQEVLKGRRSCRDFKPDSLSPEQVGQILDAAVWAPSPLNLQPWEFVVITDPGVKADLKTACEEAKKAVLDAGGPGWVAKYSMDFVAAAPVIFAVLFNPQKGGLGMHFNQPSGAFSAACAATQNLMLAGAELGMGSVWLTFFDPAKVRAILGVPEKLEIAGLIPMGRPAGVLKAPPRKSPKTHQDRYSNKKL